MANISLYAPQCKVFHLTMIAVEVAIGLPVQLKEVTISDLGSGINGTLLVGGFDKAHERKLDWLVHNNGQLDFEIDGVNYGGTYYGNGEIWIAKKGNTTVWVGTSWQNRREESDFSRTRVA